ncbi:hypothetical protein GCM10017783_22050 [Deinococcus piscis]|uniref:DUF4180 domain-containing protein n=1 Tax=Deinococcus piscis TaxID=394230 RepID=A0ABQ3KCY7_9DEIO|nr:DUF4180 domain-containing protein [Deinococcus piscis]GHG09044.1 hypothetical protein GCM10017783_22050 [Deinococcus piscis]
MQASLVRRPAGTYLSVVGQPGVLSSGEATLELVGLSWEHGSELLLLDGALLPPEVFDLKCGLAGELAQKFSNYRLQVAAVLPPSAELGERFREFMTETNRGRIFGLFADREAAEAWLLGSN